MLWTSDSVASQAPHHSGSRRQRERGGGMKRWSVFPLFFYFYYIFLLLSLLSLFILFFCLTFCQIHCTHCFSFPLFLSLSRSEMATFQTSLKTSLPFQIPFPLHAHLLKPSALFRCTFNDNFLKHLRYLHFTRMQFKLYFKVKRRNLLCLVITLWWLGSNTTTEQWLPHFKLQLSLFHYYSCRTNAKR